MLTKHRLNTKRDFVCYISHEIRTPLNTVLMGLHLAIKELDRLDNIPGRNTHQAKEIVGECYESCNNVVEILNDILTEMKANFTNCEVKSLNYKNCCSIFCSGSVIICCVCLMS